MQTGPDATYHHAWPYAELRQAVHELAVRAIAPHAADVDASSRFPREAYEALVAAGFHAPHIPEEYGGSGADEIATCIVVEEVARACASSSLIPAVNELGSLPVILAGSAELKSEVLPPLARGEAMFSYALSERESGSDAGAMRARATPDGDTWVLNGTKAWITHAGISTYYTVMAKTDPTAGTHGVSAFVVHRDDVGFSVGAPEHKLGIKGSPTGSPVFEDVRVPAANVIGEVGRGLSVALGTLERTRLGAAAQAVGIAQGATDYAVAYAKERVTFGKPIIDHQGIQFKLADMATRTAAARELLYTACSKADRGDADLARYSSMAKLFASDTAMEVTVEGVQVLGGYGYVKDYPLERMMRDAKITQIYEGTNEIQRVVIARSLSR